jgi:serine/threonine-protein kinase
MVRRPFIEGRVTEAGALIGQKYRLARLLGEGGMGAVWAATNELIERAVAIKLMQPSLATNAEALHRFFNEARICASIRHPGIVDVLDMGTAEDGSPFIVMELLEGEPLDAWIDRGPMPALAALEVVRDVARTLALAHAKNVVHRDLKPANLFLHRGPSGGVQVKILDFGISKVMHESSAYATRTGAVLGSPAYMSPEQAGGTPVDFRTDIYALGVILFEALSGCIPFHDTTNTNALLVAIATREPPRLTEIAPNAPAAVVAITDRALRRLPHERFESANALATACDAAIAALRHSEPSVALAELVEQAAGVDELARASTGLAATTPAPPLAATRPSSPVVPSGHDATQRPAVTVAPLSTTNGVPPQGALRGRAALIALGAGAIAALSTVLWMVQSPSTRDETPASSTGDEVAPVPTPSPSPSIPAPEIGPVTRPGADPTPPTRSAAPSASAAAPKPPLTLPKTATPKPPVAASASSAPTAAPPPPVPKDEASEYDKF